MSSGIDFKHSKENGKGESVGDIGRTDETRMTEC